MKGRDKGGEEIGMPSPGKNPAGTHDLSTTRLITTAMANLRNNFQLSIRYHS